ncbi:MAG: hypothetical protein A2825_03515 [Candidatus Taylorbacteria bacterium RIFCSPHIGHO2_01_FULL_43_120]|nr:MAG: hypothetical protein A2825_03515 [Candidatus Taylorbacteria bacterium RIFCSPHIGHO2_01_FULL_43_120]OHA23782.1 MAG: hypothetical protein A3B98_03045 [Candidatus Taylorbacteria bacterium RIFCSPHIGHO2_02_FULL_43_55]OHA31986.1 MAG: hypothetical protein A3B09_01200 [Candidatus Taylorbacteria bacterium RIFCSPLOWO2_01_FULL_43_83]OHA38009.1 MAG: hypothetical protein A3H58_01615 [Candidatus Taylorbacteria bacterium RIFCSPLOWO2_02_FULL_43_22b]
MIPHFSCQLLAISSLVKNTNQRLQRFGRSPDRSVGDEYEWERKEDTPSLVPLRSKRASAEQERGRGGGEKKLFDLQQNIASYSFKIP